MQSGGLNSDQVSYRADAHNVYFSTGVQRAMTSWSIVIEWSSIKNSIIYREWFEVAQEYPTAIPGEN